MLRLLSVEQVLRIYNLNTCNKVTPWGYFNFICRLAKPDSSAPSSHTNGQPENLDERKTFAPDEITPGNFYITFYEWLLLSKLTANRS